MKNQSGEDCIWIANVVISFVFCSNKDAVANEHSRKVYADLDAVQTAVVSSSLGPDLHAEVIVPLAEEPVGAPTIMQWEYLDPNTVRTYDIPIHITATPADYTFESLTGLPQGFTPLQQFPYNNSISSQPPPPPVASSSSSANNNGDHQSILIQRVPHRHRKGRTCKFSFSFLLAYYFVDSVSLQAPLNSFDLWIRTTQVEEEQWNTKQRNRYSI